MQDIEIDESVSGESIEQIRMQASGPLKFASVPRFIGAPNNEKFCFGGAAMMRLQANPELPSVAIEEEKKQSV